MMLSPDAIAPAEAWKRRALTMAARLGCFDADDYLALNPDLASVDLLEHFADHGVWEGRRAVTAERLTARLARAIALTDLRPLGMEAMVRGFRGAMAAAPSIHRPAKPTAAEITVCDRLIAALDAVGVEATLKEGRPKSSDENPIVVNPVRLFGYDRATIDLGALSTTVMVATDDPDSGPFSQQLPYLLAAGGVVALEAETYALFHDAGVPAALWGATPSEAPTDRTPALHPLFEGLSRVVRSSPADAPWTDRPIDVLALEPASVARSAAWRHLAGKLLDRQTVVHQPAADLPSTKSEADLRRYLYARAKVVLHLHEDMTSSLSSRMIEEAAAAGAVIVSEPARPHPFIEPGRHYFEASARRIPDLIDTLISSKAGAAKARAAVAASREALASAFDLEAMGLRLVNLLLDASGSNR